MIRVYTSIKSTKIAFIPIIKAMRKNTRLSNLKGGFGSPGELKMTDEIHDINQG